MQRRGIAVEAMRQMKYIRRRWVWAQLALGLIVITLALIWFTFTSNRAAGGLTASSANGAMLENIDDYGIVPDWTLTERSGQTMTLADLRGKIWTADFFYSQCTETCPIQTGY